MKKAVVEALNVASGSKKAVKKDKTKDIKGNYVTMNEVRKITGRLATTAEGPKG